MARGKCREKDPRIFHPESGGRNIYRPAIRACAGCPVERECLAFALDHMNDDAITGLHGVGMFGVWGATSPQERWQMVGRRPSQHGMAA